LGRRSAAWRCIIPTITTITAVTDFTAIARSAAIFLGGAAVAAVVAAPNPAIVGLALDRLHVIQLRPIHPTHGPIVIHQGRSALGLLRGHIPQPNTFVSEKDG
jgi:hypothetical protein